MKTEFISNITLDSLRYAKELGGDVPDYEEELMRNAVRMHAIIYLAYAHMIKPIVVLDSCRYPIHDRLDNIISARVPMHPPTISLKYLFAFLTARRTRR